MGKEQEDILEELSQAVEQFDAERAREVSTKAIQLGLNPVTAIKKGLAKGVKIIGDRFEKGEAFLVELVMAGEAMKAGTEVLMQDIRKRGLSVRKLGLVLIGTVHGDSHDIGKNIVISMLEAAGFEVIDLGVDVPSEKFVEKVRDMKPDVLGMSALLSTTAPEQGRVISKLEQDNLRDEVKVIIGGAATSESWASQINADAYASDAVEAVKKVKGLLGIKED